MRVVLDTNVFVSGIFWTGDSHRIIRAWRERRFMLVISPEIIEEIVQVLSDFKIRLPDDLISQWAKLIVQNSVVVDDLFKMRVVIEDPTDDKFINAALSGQSAYIISQDRHLLRYSGFKGIQVLNPKAFLLLLDKNNS